MKRGKFYQIKVNLNDGTREAVEHSGYIDEENQIGYFKDWGLTESGRWIIKWNALDIPTGLSVLRQRPTLPLTRQECVEVVKQSLTEIQTKRNDPCYKDYIIMRKILIESGKPMLLSELRLHLIYETAKNLQQNAEKRVVKHNKEINSLTLTEDLAHADSNLQYWRGANDSYKIIMDKVENLIKMNL